MSKQEYEEHLGKKAFVEAEDGEHAAGIVMRKERLRSELTYEDFIKGSR